MDQKYRVRVSHDDFNFSAAHFIVFEHGVCEPLHGHNYRVQVEIEGPLDGNCFVIDFTELSSIVRHVLRELNHRTLLPTQHPEIKLESSENEIEVRYGGRRWTFPRSDCALLSLENTTAELLALHVAERVLGELDRQAADANRQHGFLAIHVEIEEARGQTATCSLFPPDAEDDPEA
jgi:6-pyruvoyltetrahydropterin/6-carboxytetrahydropterin synthase